MRSNNRKQATSPISHPVTHWLLPLILFSAGKRSSLSFVPIVFVFVSNIYFQGAMYISFSSLELLNCFSFWGERLVIVRVGWSAFAAASPDYYSNPRALHSRTDPASFWSFLQGKPCQRDSRFSAAANLKLSTLGKSWEILQIVFVRNSRCDNFELIPIWCCGKISPQELGPLSISVKRYEAPFKVCTHGQI